MDVSSPHLRSSPKREPRRCHRSIIALCSHDRPTFKIPHGGSKKWKPFSLSSRLSIAVCRGASSASSSKGSRSGNRRARKNLRHSSALRRSPPLLSVSGMNCCTRLRPSQKPSSKLVPAPSTRRGVPNTLQSPCRLQTPQRSLLYTGVTCGKRHVVITGQKKAISVASATWRGGLQEWPSSTPRETPTLSRLSRANHNFNAGMDARQPTRSRPVRRRVWPWLKRQVWLGEAKAGRNSRPPIR